MCCEVVYRGIDCVSLGWCFWHRGCYGCLFCGNKAVIRGLGVEQLFETDDKAEDRPALPATRRSPEGGIWKAREVDEVPLCAHCFVEMERGGLDEAAIVQRAVQRVARSDGGLARLRWEARPAGHPEKACGQRAAVMFSSVLSSALC